MGKKIDDFYYEMWLKTNGFEEGMKQATDSLKTLENQAEKTKTEIQLLNDRFADLLGAGALQIELGVDTTSTDAELERFYNENIKRFEELKDKLKNEPLSITTDEAVFIKSFKTLETEIEKTKKQIDDLPPATKSTFQKVGDSIKGFFSNIGNNIKNVFQGLGGVIASVFSINALKGFVDQAIDAQKQTKLLDNALQNVGASYKAVKSDVESLANTNIIDDSDIKQIYSFGIAQGINNTKLKDFAQASLDYSAVSGRSLQDSMRKVGGLAKEGGEKFDQFKDSIKGAYKESMKSDPFKAFEVSFNNFGQRIGSSLLPSVTKILEFISGILDGFQQLPDAIQNTIGMITALGVAFFTLSSVIGGLPALIGFGIGATGVLIGQTVDHISKLDTAKTTIKNFWDAVKDNPSAKEYGKALDDLKDKYKDLDDASKTYFDNELNRQLAALRRRKIYFTEMQKQQQDEIKNIRSLLDEKSELDAANNMYKNKGKDEFRKSIQESYLYTREHYYKEVEKNDLATAKRKAKTDVSAAYGEIEILVNEMEKAKGDINVALKNLKGSEFDIGDIDAQIKKLEAIKAETTTIKDKGKTPLKDNETPKTDIEKAKESLALEKEKENQLQSQLQALEAQKASDEVIKAKKKEIIASIEKQNKIIDEGVGKQKSIVSLTKEEVEKAQLKSEVEANYTKIALLNAEKKEEKNKKEHDDSLDLLEMQKATLELDNEGNKNGEEIRKNLESQKSLIEGILKTKKDTLGNTLKETELEQYRQKLLKVNLEMNKKAEDNTLRILEGDFAILMAQKTDNKAKEAERVAKLVANMKQQVAILDTMIGKESDIEKKQALQLKQLLLQNSIRELENGLIEKTKSDLQKISEALKDSSTSMKRFATDSDKAFISVLDNASQLADTLAKAFDKDNKAGNLEKWGQVANASVQAVTSSLKAMGLEGQDAVLSLVDSLGGMAENITMLVATGGADIGSWIKLAGNVVNVIGDIFDITKDTTIGTSSLNSEWEDTIATIQSAKNELEQIQKQIELNAQWADYYNKIAAGKEAKSPTGLADIEDYQKQLDSVNDQIDDTMQSIQESVNDVGITIHLDKDGNLTKETADALNAGVDEATKNLQKNQGFENYFTDLSKRFSKGFWGNWLVDGKEMSKEQLTQMSEMVESAISAGLFTREDWNKAVENGADAVGKLFADAGINADKATQKYQAQLDAFNNIIAGYDSLVDLTAERAEIEDKIAGYSDEDATKKAQNRIDAIEAENNALEAQQGTLTEGSAEWNAIEDKITDNMKEQMAWILKQAELTDDAIEKNKLMADYYKLQAEYQKDVTEELKEQKSILDDTIQAQIDAMMLDTENFADVEKIREMYASVGLSGSELYTSLTDLGITNNTLNKSGGYTQNGNINLTINEATLDGGITKLRQLLENQFKSSF